MDTQGGNVADLENGLERLNARFSSAVGSSVPVEIVDAGAIEQTATVLGEASESGNLAHDGNGVEISMEMEGSSHELAALAQVDEVQRISQAVPVDATQLTPSISGGLEVQGVGDLHVPVTSGRMEDAVENAVSNALPTSLVDGGNLEQQLQQVSQSAIQHFQEVSRSLRSEGIEISPEAIASNFHQSLADSLAAVTMVSGGTSQSSSSVLESAINHSTHGLPMGISMNYSDLEDVNRVINSGIDPNLTVSSSMANTTNPGAHMHTTPCTMDTILNDSNVPSSPESNFDTADLLNTTLAQDDEVTTKLASSGPAGMAAAAAILSGSRKRKRHSFESNPALRKRQCSKLLRRLKETIEELSTRVGLQSCVVTYKPSFKNDKPDPSFKVFGTSPLTSAVEQQKDKIISVMDEQLQKQAPETASKPPPAKKEQLFDLPPLVFDGIPTPVNEMTQAQLRCFIPNMMKFSTGRGKPGWGKPEMKPQWWPDDIPWQNVRSDSRHEGMKKVLPWTEALRKIIVACYVHHNRTDLLPNFSSKNQEESIVPAEMMNQQQQLLHQGIGLVIPALQQTISSTNGEGTATAEGVSTLAEVATNQDHLLADNQQVFTIDTGMGNCDTSGMPTLADATLAETAARLQQVADETGQVQYATQTVTVTERDAKALGQPVGTTTTVLLTAYPSSHNGATADSQQFYSEPTATQTNSETTSSAAHPSVQVVYSAAHVSELPESIVSSISTSSQQDIYSTSSDAHSEIGSQAVTDSSQYLAPPISSTCSTASEIPVHLEDCAVSASVQLT